MNRMLLAPHRRFSSVEAEKLQRVMNLKDSFLFEEYTNQFI
jgi:hypothetical protein